MVQPDKIFPTIKSLVLQVVPDAQVYLFGSRANGTATKESDWDILILTSQKVDNSLKHEIFKKVFPLSVEISSFIQTIVAEKEDWETNPSWYSLNKSIFKEKNSGMNREGAVKLKLDKAKALLEEISVHMSHGFYNTVINRLYYACFYATQALLLTENIVSKTHRGTISLLHEHFVLKGKFPSHHANFIGELMNQRMDKDYGDFLILEEAEINSFIEPAKNYVAYIEELIKSL